MRFLGELTGAGVIHDKAGTYLAVQINGETHLLYAERADIVEQLSESASYYADDVDGGAAAEGHP